jgi:hypothetical protein
VCTSIHIADPFDTVSSPLSYSSKPGVKRRILQGGVVCVYLAKEKADARSKELEAAAEAAEAEAERVQEVCMAVHQLATPRLRWEVVRNPFLKY